MYTRVHTPTRAPPPLSADFSERISYFLFRARHRAFIENVSNDFNPPPPFLISFAGIVRFPDVGTYPTEMLLPDKD